MQEHETQAKLRDYQIVIEGQIGPDFAEWLGAQQAAGDRTTALTLPSADQTALRGLLSRLWDLNLTVISVNVVEASNR